MQLSHRHVFNEESHDGAIQTVNGHHHQDDRLGKWPHLDISFTSAYMIIIIKVRYYITFPTPQKNLFLPPLVVVRGEIHHSLFLLRRDAIIHLWL